MHVSDEVQKGLVAGAFGLVGTLTPAVISWRRDRDVATARSRKLDEATRRVAFWDAWLKLSTQTCTPADDAAIARVKKELSLLCEIVETDSAITHTQLTTQLNISTEFASRVHEMPFWQRWLLFYRPQRSLAWFPRLLFYLGAAFLPLLLIVGIDDKTLDSSGREGFEILLVMNLMWIFVFRFLSKWLEVPHPSAIAPPGRPTVIVAGTPPPPPPRP